jgi:hypothetical protein
MTLSRLDGLKKTHRQANKISKQTPTIINTRLFIDFKKSRLNQTTTELIQIDLRIN